MKLKLYQQTILETNISDFAGLNVTNYHEKLMMALQSAHQASLLEITLGSQLLVNHTGPTYPGYVSLISISTANMHTLKTSESQFKEVVVQLPQLEMVYRNSIILEATHKNQGGACVAEGLQQKAMPDLGCNKMGRYKSEYPLMNWRGYGGILGSAKAKKKSRSSHIEEK